MKFIIIYFICFLIFCAWRAYEQHKSERLEQKATDDFWARELEANHTRKKDISHLPLLKVTQEDLPEIYSADPSIVPYIDQLYESIKLPMLDLSEYSNTDLKLAYGAANFKTLSQYDNNYTTFLSALSNLAHACCEKNLYQEAGLLYEAALSYGSKQLSDYTELATVYLKSDSPENITKLINRVEAADHPRKNTIIESLQQIMLTYQ